MKNKNKNKGTKWAVEGLSESIRRELKPFGVSVSVVEPAYVSTPIGDKVCSRWEGVIWRELFGYGNGRE